MSVETLPCLSSPCKIPDSLTVTDNLCKFIVELGGGIFAGVCRAETLVCWHSATGALLYCSIDRLSADAVRKITLDSDSLTVVTQVEP
jgi:hypothetical protein